MKKLKTIIVAGVMMISFVFIGSAISSNGTSAAAAQDKVYYKTKRGSRKVYSKGKWVTKTTWHNGKRISKKVWVKGNSIGHKAGRGIKRVFTRTDRRRP